jgi:hypothetical protein
MIRPSPAGGGGSYDHQERQPLPVPWRFGVLGHGHPQTRGVLAKGRLRIILKTPKDANLEEVASLVASLASLAILFAKGTIIVKEDRIRHQPSAGVAVEHADHLARGDIFVRPIGSVEDHVLPRCVATIAASRECDAPPGDPVAEGSTAADGLSRRRRGHDGIVTPSRPRSGRLDHRSGGARSARIS